MDKIVVFLVIAAQKNLEWAKVGVKYPIGTPTNKSCGVVDEAPWWIRFAFLVFFAQKILE